jgi:type I restriction enzyme S subunit
VIADLPDGWRTVPFREILTTGVRNGIYKPKQFHGQGAKIVNMGELFEHPRLRAIPMHRVQVDVSERQRFGLIPHDLLFARRSLVAEGAGRCSIVLEVDEPTVFESSIIRARPDPAKADPLYLYYLWSSPIGVYLLGTIRRQVAVAGVTGTDLEQLELPLPPPEEQRAISAVLAALDDRIEHSRRTSRALERLARVIFKAWFVDFEPVKAKIAGEHRFASVPQAVFDALPDRLVSTEFGAIPGGWEMRPLDAIADFLNGLALQKYPPRGNRSDLPVLKIAELRKGLLQGADQANSDVPAAYVINDGDLLFSWSGTLEAKPWFGGRGALNQHLFKVTSSTHPKWFLHQWIHEHMPEFRVIAHSKATTMGHIKRSHLSDAMVAVPDSGFLQAADAIIDPVYSLIGNLALTARSLTRMRDLLLPILLSGEMRVEASDG